MATDPRKKQKQAERRTAKRKEKRQVLARDQGAGLPERLTAAAKFPVLHCCIGERLAEAGMGMVFLSRELPGGQVAVASFLVDRYCLGVKDAHSEILPRGTYDAKYVRKMRKEHPARTAPPAEARKLIEQVIAYAQGLGLPPHADSARARLLFGDVNAADSDASFEFGKDGKPLFIAGPNDTPERCRQILAALHASCGPGNYHYMIPLSGPDPDEAVPEALRGEMVLRELEGPPPG